MALQHNVPMFVTPRRLVVRGAALLAIISCQVEPRSVTGVPGLARPGAAVASASGPNEPPGFTRFAEHDFTRPMALDEVIRDVEGMMRKWHVQVTHPRYFGLFNPSTTVASVIATGAGAGGAAFLHQRLEHPQQV